LDKLKERRRTFGSSLKARAAGEEMISRLSQTITTIAKVNKECEGLSSEGLPVMESEKVVEAVVESQFWEALREALREVEV
jgi:hypothetical protein